MKKNRLLLGCVVFLMQLIFCGVHAEVLSKNKIILPAQLKTGDTVALVSSGFRVTQDDIIQYAIERLEALGLKVKLGDAIFKKDFYFAGTDQERADDINKMFADPKIKAIFEVRGGWGSNRILPYLNYKMIQEHPKIFLGFSDITSLLLAIHAKTGLVTFHGPMNLDGWPDFTVDYLKQVLFSGEKVVFKNPTEIDLKKDIIQTENRIHVITNGVASGKLLGGNLTVLTSMLGSPYLPDWKGAILFVEAVDEDYYKIDRMMDQLKMAGVLNQISGFIFGQCTGCSAGRSTDSASILGSFTLNQILDHYIKPLGIPAWSGAMIGHMSKVFTLPEGAPVKIDAAQGTITLL